MSRHTRKNTLTTLYAPQNISPQVEEWLVATRDRPLTLIQQRNIAHAAPEYQESDMMLSRLFVAAVELAIQRYTQTGQRALLLLDQPDAVNPVTIWWIPARRVQKTLQQVSFSTRSLVQLMLEHYDPEREAAILLLTAVDERPLLFGVDGSLYHPPIQPRPNP